MHIAVDLVIDIEATHLPSLCVLLLFFSVSLDQSHATLTAAFILRQSTPITHTVDCRF